MSSCFDKFLMTIWGKFLALCSFFVVLSCLFTCRAARAWTTNEWGYYLFSYDEMDEYWGDFYESYIGGEWPGVSEWLNSIPEAPLIFRDPLPIFTSSFDSRFDFSFSNKVAFLQLSPLRNYLFDGETMRYVNRSLPDNTDYSAADMINMVPDVVAELWQIASSFVDSVYPLLIRSGDLPGAGVQIRASVHAPQFEGFQIECKTVPFAWSGYWAGWYISVPEFIDNGVNPSVFGPDYRVTEPNLVWLTTNGEWYTTFSNITIRASHRWKGGSK